MTTFATLKTRVRRELQESTANTWSDDSILAWYNDGAYDFAEKVRCCEDEQYAVSVAEQESYTLPSYTIEVLACAYKGSELTRYTKREYISQSVTATASSTPTKYTIMDGALYLHPKPDTADDEIRFFRYYRPTPAASTSSTQDTPFGSLHDDALCNYIKARAFEQVGDFASAQNFDALYNREVEETKFEEQRADDADGWNEPRLVY